MINGGTASVYVTSMDEAIDFYTNKLGLPLKVRIADEWAEIDASGLIIGLHIARPPETPAAGTIGAISIELHVTGPMEVEVEKLSAKNVPLIGNIQNYENVRIASVADPDGNIILLAEVLHG